jgi:hypothetical protein
VDTNAARSPKRFIPQNRWQQGKETNYIHSNYQKKYKR